MSSAQTNPCSGYTGWQVQTDPETDSTGLDNTNFPEGSATSYYNVPLTAPIGATVKIFGQYPLARFMSLEIYSTDVLVDFIDDAAIAPDPGQNNPYVSGTTSGTYTVDLVFGAAPATPAPNSIYTGTYTTVSLMYRMYHTTNPNDPSGGAALPTIIFGGKPLVNCPVQPILPAGSTPWWRLASGDWIGTPPDAAQQMPVRNPPAWTITNPNGAHFFPNGADFYIGTQLSRQFIQPYGPADLFVIRFLAPTFPNTRDGDPVYLNRQVRYWSICTDDPYTTNVNRCVADDASPLNPNGYVLYVVSDPGSVPSAESLSKFYASWLPWGALEFNTDVVYDRRHQPWGTNTPVQYYNDIIYRQTLAEPSFTQSIENISLLPAAQQKAAMGPYWPVSGYCTTANFETYGVDCLLHN